MPVDRRLLVTFSLGTLVGLFLVYFQTRGFDFIDADTPVYVLHPRVLAPPTLENLWWLLTHPIEVNWTPLSWYSHIVDHQLFGPDSGLHHLSNVAYHAAATIAVFALLAYATAAPWRSLAVALLFAFHPLRVESVAWVVERKDMLSGLFGALALLAYARYAKTSRRPWYAGAWLLFFASLLSKAMLVTMPALLLVLDFWPLSRTRLTEPAARAVSWSRLLLEKLPFLPPAIFVSYMARHGVDYTTASHAELTLAERLANAVFSVAQYVRKSFLPVDLSFWYPHPYLPSTGGPSLDALTLTVSALLLLLVGALCLMQLRVRPYLAAGYAWFVGTLVPVLGIYFQAGRQGMADRFSYFPSIGLAILVVWSVSDWARSDATGRRLRLAVAALVLSVGLFAYRSHVEARRWRSTESIYADTLAKNPNNTQVQYLLGQLLLQSGRVDEGLLHLTRAATLMPEWDDLVTGLANELRRAGRREQALYWYRRAYQNAPDLNHTRINLAAALAELGQHDEAATLLREAARKNPRSLATRINLGMTLAAAGKLVEAEKELGLALALDPRSIRALRLSARVRVALGDRLGAIERLSRLLQLTPDDAALRTELESLEASTAAKVAAP